MSIYVKYHYCSSQHCEGLLFFGCCRYIIYNNNDTIHKKIHKNPETCTAYVTWVSFRIVLQCRSICLFVSSYSASVTVRFMLSASELSVYFRSIWSRTASAITSALAVIWGAVSESVSAIFPPMVEVIVSSLCSMDVMCVQCIHGMCAVFRQMRWIFDWQITQRM